jgi:hypothetical protein
MREINLTEAELFKNLIEIQDVGIYIDLHNDYSCSRLLYDPAQSGDLLIEFLLIGSEKPFKKVEIVFGDVRVTKMSLQLFDGIHINLTIDNMYRGRFQLGDALYEYSNSGRSYYYVDFYEGYAIELFARSLMAIL